MQQYVEDFDPLLPHDEVHEASRQLLAKCPVAHSELGGGFWIVNKHADILQIMQDSEGFASGNRGVRIPDEPVERPYLPPIDSNPPDHRQVRALENPFLTPKALKAHEPLMRSIIGGLVEDFAQDGEADIIQQLGKVFPAQITFQTLFSIDDPAELEQARTWVRRLSYDLFREDPEILAGLQADWTAWCYELLARRRAEERKPDLLDALIHGTVGDGRSFTDLELVGAIQILTFGGFSTTADATGNIIVRMIDTPGMEERLRAEPELIPAFIEEVLRLEPAVTARPRRATRDIEVGGKLIRKDERVLCNYLAANVDPDEWEDPEEFVVGRARNRVMTFGTGPHRCIGSNMARMTLRIMLEEVLARIGKIDFQEGRRETRVSFNPSAWRAVDALPIRFEALDHTSA